MARAAVKSDAYALHPGLNANNTALTNLVTTASTARATLATTRTSQSESDATVATAVTAVQTAITAVQTAITAQIVSAPVVVDIDLAVIKTVAQLNAELAKLVDTFRANYGLI